MLSRLYGSDFFISYRQSDGAAIAQALHAELGRGYSVFLDTQDYLPGSNWLEETVPRVRGSTVVVFLATAEALHSWPVDKELEVALQRGKKIVPIKLFEGTWEDKGDGRLPSIGKALSQDVLHIDASADLNAIGSLDPEPLSVVARKIETTLAGLKVQSKRQLLFLAVVASIAGLVATATLFNTQRAETARRADLDRGEAMVELATSIVAERPAEAVMFALGSLPLIEPSSDRIKREARRTLASGYRRLSMTSGTFGRESAIRSARYSASGDVVVGITEDLEARLWESGGMLAESERLSFGNRDIALAAFSPDATLMVAGSGRGTITVWDVNRREIRLRVETHAPITGTRFSPNGDRVAIYGYAGVVFVLDIASGVLTELPSGADRLYGAAFSRDGRSLASWGQGLDLSVWRDVGEKFVGGQASHPWASPFDSVTGAAFNAEGTIIASRTSGSNVLRFWDVGDTSHPLRELELGTHLLAEGTSLEAPNRPVGGMFIDEQERFLAATEEGALYLVDWRAEHVRTVHSLEGGDRWIGFEPIDEGQTALLASTAEMFFVDAERGTIKRLTLPAEREDGDALVGMAVSTDRSEAVLWTEAGIVLGWNVLANEWRVVASASGAIVGVDLHPVYPGSAMLYWTESGDLHQVVEPLVNVERFGTREPYGDQILSEDGSARGRFVDESTLELIGTGDGHPFGRCRGAPFEQPHSAIFRTLSALWATPTSPIVAMRSSVPGTGIRICNTETGTVFHELPADMRIVDARFDGQGRLAMVGRPADGSGADAWTFDPARRVDRTPLERHGATVGFRIDSDLESATSWSAGGLHTIDLETGESSVLVDPEVLYEDMVSDRFAGSNSAALDASLPAEAPVSIASAATLSRRDGPIFWNYRDIYGYENGELKRLGLSTVDGVDSVTFDPDERFGAVLTSSGNGVVVDVERFDVLGLLPSATPIETLAVSASGEIAASAGLQMSRDAHITFWNATSGEILDVLLLEMPERLVFTSDNALWVESYLGYLYRIDADDYAGGLVKFACERIAALASTRSYALATDLDLIGSVCDTSPP